MYLWKIEELKEEIKQGRLSESDKFKYLLINVVIMTCALLFTQRFGLSNPNIWDNVYSIFMIIVAPIGVLLAYKANHGATGNDFLGKYFSIGLVISIRFFALLIPLTIALGVYYAFSYNLEKEIPSSAFDTIPFIIWTVLLYWRIIVHIKQCNTYPI